MTRIRINIAEAENAAGQLRRAGSGLSELGGELDRAVGQLDLGVWQGTSRARIEPLLSQVDPRVRELAGVLGEQGARLMGVAEAFGRVDRESAQELSALPWVDFALSKGKAGSADGGAAPDGEEPFVRGQGDGFDIQYDDVRQGQLKDCYLMAALAAVAKDNPEIIRDMIQDNGDGTFTVTFHTHGLFAWSEWGTEEVTVRAEDLGEYGTSADQGELWPAIIERAYAEWQADGSYEGIEWGDSRNALAALTGVVGKNYVPFATWGLGDKIEDALEKGNPVTVGFVIGDLNWVQGDEGITGEHACAVVGIDGDQVTIYDQAKGTEFTTSLNHLKTHANWVSVSPLHGRA
jgi:uncharacterized protein YukE